jgi:hypothetical protein
MSSWLASLLPVSTRGSLSRSELKARQPPSYRRVEGIRLLRSCGATGKAIPLPALPLRGFRSFEAENIQHWTDILREAQMLNDPFA